MIHAVGIGPGDPGLMTTRAQALLEQADVVTAFDSVLAVVDGIGEGRRVPLTYRDQTERLAEITMAHRTGERCVVCFMGDPGFSGRQLVDRVEAACGEAVAVVPGISSAQVAAARAGIGFEEAAFVTFHKRGPIDADREFLAMALGQGRGAVVLPRPWDYMPDAIARDLGAWGIDRARAVEVFESLTGDERAWSGRLDEIDDRFSDISVMVVHPAAA